MIGGPGSSVRRTRPSPSRARQHFAGILDEVKRRLMFIGAGIAVVAVGFGVLVALGRSDETARSTRGPQPELPASTLSPRAAEAATAAVAQQVGDREGARRWLTERVVKLDRFTQAARSALTGTDCDGPAQNLNEAVGDLKTWLTEVGTAPDDVLRQTLLATSLAARDTLTACASAPDKLEAKRLDLDTDLAAFAARRAQVLR